MSLPNPAKFTVRDVPQAAGPLVGILGDIKKALSYIGGDAASLSALVNGGLVRVGSGGNLLPPSTGEEERIVPPQPIDVVWDSAISNVLVTYAGFAYVGHSHAEILRGPTNDYSAASVVLRSYGGVAADPVGPGREAYYWVRFVSRSMVAGPPDTQTGTLVRTGEDVSALLGILEGQITESQLFADLGARIDLVDGPDFMVGSVAERILNEANARGAAITSEANTRQAEDESLASQIDSLTASTGDNAAAISAEAIARASADGAIASDVTTLAARVTTNEGDISTNVAAISSEAIARASADGAIASDVTTLFASVGGNTAAISSESIVRADETGYLGAQATLRIDVGGVVGGYGISGTSSGGAGATIDFGVRANKFYIMPPAGVSNVGAAAFIHQATPTTVGGVSVPAGTYLSDAFIMNGTIINAKIANLAVDDAKIANLAVNKLTAGSISVGEHIQSSNYVASSAGWKIHGNGTAEFAAASIRGQLTASQIDTRNLDIKDAAGNIIFSSGTNLSSSRVVPDAGWLNTQITLSGGSGVVQLNGAGGGSLGNIVMAGNPITSANISTYMASAAIGDAYILNLNAAKLTAGSITTDKLAAGSITTDRLTVNAASVVEFGSNIADNAYPAATDTTATIAGTTAATIVTSGTPLFLLVRVTLNLQATNTGIQYFSVNSTIYIDGVGEPADSSPAYMPAYVGGSSARQAILTMPIVVRKPLSSGSHVVAVASGIECRDSSGAPAQFGASTVLNQYITVVAMENKV